MPTYNKVNSKLLSVTLGNEQIFTKRGSMIAYKGQVNFAKSMLAGGGIQSLAMRSVTNEGLAMMTASGSGEVFLGHNGMTVMVIPLRGETLFVEGSSLLAFDQRLRAGVMFMGSQGVGGLVRGAMTGHGLFTSTLEGTGEVAILSKGNTIGLPVEPHKPIFVDPQAYIGHRGQLQSEMKTDASWKTFVGQGSGETFQLKFTGQGTVYIQASER